MRLLKKSLPLLLSLSLVVTMFSSCGKSETDGASDNSSNSSDSSATANFAESDADMFTERDMDATYDVNNSVTIKLGGDTATASSDAVKISGSTVTITDEGTYVISGTLDDGMIVVNAEETDKPQLVFDGVSVNSETSAPLYIIEGDKVFVTLASGSKNTLTNGGTFEAIDDNNIDGAVFSKQDLTFNGSGSLTVNSPAGHGIVCKDDLVFTSGTYAINSASHGLDANDSVRAANVAVTIAAGKDGIHAENSDDETLGFVYISSGTYGVSGEGDGISAAAYMQLEGGTFDIVSGGGSANAAAQTSESWGGFMGGQGGKGGMGGKDGMGGAMPGGKGGNAPMDVAAGDTDDSSTSIKGLKSSGSMLINAGTFKIDSADDAVHSNASITVNGGTFNIASGDDGFHADEALTITSGTIDITESYEGLEALNVSVKGGDISLVASDDGLNAAGGTDASGFGGERGNDMFGGMGGKGGPGGASSNGSVVISGGDLYVNASGDGIDANGYLEITGGYTVVCGPTQGDTATLDYDTSATISGGTFIGTGASGMAQTFSDSKQGLISVSVGNQTAGTEITLKNSSGKTIVSHTPELSFSVVILSSPDIVSGETYTIDVGGTTADFEAD